MFDGNATFTGLGGGVTYLSVDDVDDDDVVLVGDLSIRAGGARKLGLWGWSPQWGEDWGFPRGDV